MKKDLYSIPINHLLEFGMTCCLMLLIFLFVTACGPGPLAKIVVTPNSVRVAQGQTFQFTAKGYDASGNAVSITPTWSCSPELGTINSSGLFTASNLGTGTVTAAVGTISGTASVEVSVLSSIVVTPNVITVWHSMTYQLTAKGYNASGSEVAINPTWSCDPNVGTVTQQGLFTASGYGTCSVEASVGAIKGSAIVHAELTGTLSRDLTLRKEYNPYVLGDFTIETYRLTIEPGVVVKGVESSYIDVNGGSLLSQGTEETPIYFTSIHDDSVCGDTDNDGGATQPDFNDWSGIDMYGESSMVSISYAHISYGTVLRSVSGSLQVSNCWLSYMSQPGPPKYAAVLIDGGSVNVTGCQIDNSNCGIMVWNTDDETGYETVINGNTITNCSTAAIYVQSGIDGVDGMKTRPIITGNTGSGNGINGICMEGIFSGDWTLYANNPGLPFSIKPHWEPSGDHFTIKEGATLTIEPGVVVKVISDWDHEAILHIKGKLLSQGTADNPVIFTSDKDDTIQGWGDTNNDGPSQGSPGDWGTLVLSNATQPSTLSYTHIRYGGGGGFSGFDISAGSHQVSNCRFSDILVDDYSDRNAVHISGGNPTLSGCQIYDCPTLHWANGVVSITGGNPTLSGCQIYDCPGGQNIEGAVYVTGGNPTLSGCQIYDMSTKGVNVGGGSPTISGNTIENCTTGIDIAGGNGSQLQGNTIKSCPSGISVSSGDDSVITGNRLEMCEQYGISVSSCSPAVTGNTIVGFEGKGLYLKNYAGQATGNDISGCDYGVYTEGNCSSTKVTGNKIYNNSQAGILNAGAQFINATNNWWGDVDGPSPYGKCNSIQGLVWVLPWQGMAEYYARLNGDSVFASCVAEPINPNTGNFYSTHTDMKFEGRGIPAEITRTYNSIDHDVYSPMGFGWTFTYSERIEPYPYEQGDLSLIAPDGTRTRYTNQGNGTYLPADENYTVLVKNPDGTYTLSADDGSYKTFDVEGAITKLVDTNQNETMVGHDAEGNVTSVTDASGQTTTLNYNDDGRIESVVDPSARTVSYEYDSSGNLTHVVGLNGGTTTYTYDDDHKLLTITDPNGSKFVENTYDEVGRVSEQVDAQGKHFFLEYDMAGHVTSYTDAEGNECQLEDDKRLYQTQLTDPKGEQEQFEYDDDGNLVSYTDKRGSTTTYTYDGNGNRLSETNPLGKTTAYTYDEKGNVLTITDPLGRITVNTYDASCNLLTTTDPEGHTTTSTFNEFGQVLTSQDQRGNITTNVYDVVGNLVEVHNPDGGVICQTFDEQNRRVASVDPEGNTTTFEYDDAGHLLRMTDPDNNTFNYSYDADGNQRTVTDPLGNVYESTYDSMGREHETIDPLGHAITYSYDGNGNQISKIDPQGNTASYEYDELNRLWKTVDPKGNATTKTFDAAGNVLTETDGCGKTTTHSYDALGSVLTDTDPCGSTIEHVYDAAGQEIETIDARENSTHKTYDGCGRIKTVTDSQGNTLTFFYDECGNKTADQDPQGNVTQYHYDNMNRLTQVVDPEGRTTSYAYDHNGNRISVTDGAGKTTTYSYDGLNRLVSTRDPLGDTTSYEYDQAGRKSSMTDGKGAVTTYDYDECSHLVKETDPMGRETTYNYDECGRLSTKADSVGSASYTYDGNDNIEQAEYGGGLVEAFTYDGCNRPLMVTNSNSNIIFSYDGRGKVKTAATPLATASYTYDADGNPTQKVLTTSKASRTFTYAYDSRNQMISAASQGSSTTYGYNSLGKISTKTYPNGIETNYGYDNSMTLSTLQIKKGPSSLKSYSIQSDGRANITGILEDGTDLTTYAYDDASRLIGENSTHAGNVTYTYDGAGNRLAKTVGTNTTNYNYNQADELTSDSDGNAYTYNGRGELNRMVKGSHQINFAWSGKGQLIGASDGASLDLSFTYDPLDRIHSMTDGGQISYEVHDSNVDKELLTLDGSQNIVASCLSGADGLISATTPGGTSYFSYSPHNDTALTTDTQGNITEELHYDAWGNITTTSDLPYTYLGLHQKRTIHDLGIIKMGARYYQPATGRFISKDPLAGHDQVGISHNPYVYAYDDPVNLTDITGKNPYSDWLREWAYAHYNAASWSSSHSGRESGWQFSDIADGLMRVADLYDKLAKEAPGGLFDQLPYCESLRPKAYGGKVNWETERSKWGDPISLGAEYNYKVNAMAIANMVKMKDYRNDLFIPAKGIVLGPSSRKYSIFEFAISYNGDLTGGSRILGPKYHQNSDSGSPHLDWWPHFSLKYWEKTDTTVVTRPGFYLKVERTFCLRIKSEVWDLVSLMRKIVKFL